MLTIFRYYHTVKVWEREIEKVKVKIGSYIVRMLWWKVIWNLDAQWEEVFGSDLTSGKLNSTYIHTNRIKAKCIHTFYGTPCIYVYDINHHFLDSYRQSQSKCSTFPLMPPSCWLRITTPVEPGTWPPMMRGGQFPLPRSPALSEVSPSVTRLVTTSDVIMTY